MMNLDGTAFVDVAFLLGVADQFDSRSAVSADLDRDGRVDLLVTEHLADEGEKIEPTPQRLFHIERNKNANIVVYDAIVRPDSNLAEEDPSRSTG